MSRAKPFSTFAVPDGRAMPAHIVEWFAQRDGSLDFSTLRARLHELVTEIEPIRIPSRQMWEALQVQKSLGLPFDYAYYWALHFYRAPEKFRKRVEEFNTAVEHSGLLHLARDEEPDVNTLASIIRRGISEARISTAFIESWFKLGELDRQLRELQAANEEMAHLLKVGADEAVIGQRVWYARWLLANANPLEEERRDAESDLADLCRDILRGTRKVPNGWALKQDWFRKLLPSNVSKVEVDLQIKVMEKGAERGLLANRFTRLSNDTVRELAAHPCITADMLPPLMASEFPSKSD
jgi:hypothetical protein